MAHPYPFLRNGSTMSAMYADQLCAGQPRTRIRAAPGRLVFIPLRSPGTPAGRNCGPCPDPDCRAPLTSHCIDLDQGAGCCCQVCGLFWPGAV